MPFLNLLQRVWHSPTCATWASFAARSLTLVVVLPLALRKLDDQTVVVWQLFNSIIALQLLLDLGLTTTFQRLIAFAVGGLKEFPADGRVAVSRDGTASPPNWDLVETIWCTLRTACSRLTVMAFVVLGLFGSLALWKPIGALSDPSLGWMAWAIVLVTAPLGFHGLTYSAYLQGTNHIAVLRRWEALTALASSATGVLVLMLDNNLVTLVLAIQLWSVVGILRNRHIARGIMDGRLRTFRQEGIDTDIFAVAWPAAWRSGIGVLITTGYVQFTGILYSQSSAPEAAAHVASYFVALRFMSAINQFSQAPFYSKLPLLAQQLAQGRAGEVIVQARQGMRLALWTFLFAATVAGVALPGILVLTDSNVRLDPLMWWLLAAAFLAERFGAMHLQLYSLTNHIVWHVVSAVSGTITVATLLLTYRFWGPYAFPVSILSGFAGFYCWYNATRVYRAFGIRALQFERSVTVPVAITLVCAAALHWWFAAN